jgi:hypothetical protein
VRTFAILVSLAVLHPLFAASSDSMVVGPVTLTLGMRAASVESQLGQTHRLVSAVTRQPITLGGDDGNAALNALVESKAGTPVVALTFEQGKLTRAVRFVSVPGQQRDGNPDPFPLVAPILAEWKSIGLDITVRANHYAQPDGVVDELVFEAGDRQVHVLSIAGVTQIVENLGRGDVASISYTP